MGILEHKKSPGNNFWAMANKDNNFNCSDVDANNEYLRGMNWLTDTQTDWQTHRQPKSEVNEQTTNCYVLSHSTIVNIYACYYL